MIICLCICMGYNCADINKNYNEIKNEHVEQQQKSNEIFAEMLNSVRYYVGNENEASYSGEKCSYMLAKIESMQFALRATDFAIKDDLQNLLSKMYFTLSYIYEEKLDYDNVMGNEIENMFDMGDVLMYGYSSGNHLGNYKECIKKIKSLNNTCENIINKE